MAQQQQNESIDLGTHFSGSSSGAAVAQSGNKRTLGDKDVVIEITHTGVCGTDLHYRKSDYCLGHEGVGLISKIGSQVKNVEVGARVGWGYVHNTDRTCDYCLSGYDTLCKDRQMFGVADKDQGSIGTRFVIDSAFVFVIPDEIPLKYAGPLQCGGATVFGAAVQADVKPWKRAGIVGIGGLGHLAIQVLRAMGVAVVVFSRTDDKKEEAMKLGAHEFVSTSANPDLADVEPVDYLFITTDRQIPWATYFKVMARNGKIVPLSVSPEEMKGVPYMPIVSEQLTIMGSLVASRKVHRDMLTFAARHKIRPIIEELPLNEAGVNEALDRLEKSDVRYRFVLSTGVKDPLFA